MEDRCRPPAWFHRRLVSLGFFLAGCVFVPLLSGAGTGWELAGPYGGSATAIAVDPGNPQRLVAGARQSLLFLSENGGNTWRLLPFPRRTLGTVTAIYVDPADPRRFLVGIEANGSTDAGLYETTDSGLSWTQIADLQGNGVHALAAWAGDAMRMAAATRQGVYLSLDSGTRWRRISPAGNHELRTVTAIAIAPDDPNTILAGTPHLPWKTTDGGRSWFSISRGMIDDSDVFSIFVNPDRPDQVLASACSGIYRSDNRGQSWRKYAGIPATHRRTRVIRQDPRDPAIIYAGTTVGLLKTTNGGATWRQVNYHEIHSLALNPADPAILYLATEDAGILRSEDRGETFSSLNRGFVNYRMEGIALAGKSLFATTSGPPPLRGLFRSDDGGKSWGRVRTANTGQEFRHLAGVPGDSKLLLAAGADHVYRSTNGGSSWSPIAFPELGGSRGQRPVPTRIHALAAVHGSPVVFLAGTEHGLFRNTDRGATWTRIVLRPKTVLPVLALYTLAGSGGRVVVRTPGGLFLSEDYGRRWRALGVPVDLAKINDVGLAPQTGGTLLLATSEGLLGSEDLGASWTLRTQGLEASAVQSVRFHPVRKGEVLAIQYGALHRSEDGGRSWLPVAHAGLKNVFVRQLWWAAQMPGRLFGLTAETGLLLLDLP